MTPDTASTYLNMKVDLELKDGTYIHGRVDAVSPEFIHFGWISVPLHRVRRIMMRRRLA